MAGVVVLCCANGSQSGYKAVVSIAADGTGISEGGSLPSPPAAWPSTLQLRLMDSPGGAAEMKATTNFGLRYQYLSVGVDSWANCNTNGDFAKFYIQDSVASGITPVFT